MNFATVLTLTLVALSYSHPHSHRSENLSNSNKERGLQITPGNNKNSVVKVEAINHGLLLKWVGVAHKFFEFRRCIVSNLGSEEECYKLEGVKKSEVAIHFAQSRSGSGNVFAVLPDSPSMKSGGGHDAVLALDPYPNSPYGHLVAVFYLDFARTNGEKCEGDGKIKASDGTCITAAQKARCPNMLERFTSGMSPRRCHIDFLPSVFSSEKASLPPTKLSLSDSSGDNLLECIPLPGFSPCPKLRTIEDTTKILCDTAAANSKRCDTSHASVQSHCKLFQTCDRAILIGGGWNRQHSPLQGLANMQIMTEALKGLGFPHDNIKTFFANGKKGEYLSSAMKTALRGHIRSMCDTRHCADTLFLYLNNPTTFEGDFLLWDVDGNGMADDVEAYTVKEFLSDLEGCEAKRVLILAEQSNTDILLANLKASSEHQNVILISGGLPHEPLTSGEFTRKWANHSNPSACLKHVYQMASADMKGSTPVFYDGTGGLSSRLSVVGAPCDLNPSLSLRELGNLYQGCQNVPTSIWFSFDFEQESLDTKEQDDVREGLSASLTAEVGEGGGNKDDEDNLNASSYYSHERPRRHKRRRPRSRGHKKRS